VTFHLALYAIGNIELDAVSSFSRVLESQKCAPKVVRAP